MGNLFKIYIYTKSSPRDLSPLRHVRIHDQIEVQLLQKIDLILPKACEQIKNDTNKSLNKCFTQLCQLTNLQLTFKDPEMFLQIHSANTNTQIHSANTNTQILKYTWHTLECELRVNRETPSWSSAKSKAVHTLSTKDPPVHSAQCSTHPSAHSTHHPSAHCSTQGSFIWLLLLQAYCVTPTDHWTNTQLSEKYSRLRFECRSTNLSRFNGFI